MKKSKITFIALSICSIACSFSFAYALYVKVDAAVNINIEGAVVLDYYLKGNFNSWTASNEYKFTDNTSSMIPETNKIKEYVLNDISLKKDDVLKVSDSSTGWYDNFDHSASWKSTAVSKDSKGNYKVLMTSSSYDFTLKFYNDNSNKLCITPHKYTIFFQPNSNWTSESAKMAAYMWNDSGNTWKWFTESDTSGLYYVDLTSEYTSMKFVRIKKDGTLSWDDKWNESGNFTITNNDPNNCVTLDSKQWSDWTATSGVSWSAK